MIKIRQFQPNDMFSVIKIASETLTENYNPSLFNYFYETFSEGFIIAEKNHKIIGFIVGLPLNNHTAKLLMLSVIKNYRKQNIGSKLLQEFLKQTYIYNIKKIELEVRTDNTSAIQFYEKHGFKIIQTLFKFYQNQEDAYTMGKNII